MPKPKRTVRADGRIPAKVSLGNGKYKYVYAYTEKELEQKILDLKVKLGKGIDVTAERDTFGYWRDKWLRIKKTEVSAKYHESCEIASRKLDDIAMQSVTKLRSMDLQDILLDLSTQISPATGRSYSQRTIKLVKDIASSVMELALDNRVIEYNPFQKVKIPKTAKEPEQREALTEEQQQWIVNTPHRAQTAAMIMLYAGLRRGEVIPLCWRDIDLVQGSITVDKSVEFIKGRPNLKKGGKTKAAMRIVYIPEILTKYLRKQQGLPFELVCPSVKGTLMTDSSWRRMWESYIKELNFRYGKFENNIAWCKDHDSRPTSKFVPEKLPIVIPYFTAHCLRHTFITMMYMAGIDVLTAKEQAGHSDIQTTLGIYTHLNSEYKKQNVNKLDQYIGKIAE